MSTLAEKRKSTRKVISELINVVEEDIRTILLGNLPEYLKVAKSREELRILNQANDLLALERDCY